MAVLHTHAQCGAAEWTVKHERGTPRPPLVLVLNDKMRGFGRKGKFSDGGLICTSYPTPKEPFEGERGRGHISLMRGEFSFGN